jgi:cytochrome b561
MNSTAVATPQGYTTTAKVLHWSIAAVVVTLLVIGTAMVHLEWRLDTTILLYQTHKSMGVLVLILMLVRVVWRLVHAPPAFPSQHSRTRNLVAQVVHAAIYALVLALPIIGWLQVSTAPIAFPTVVFGAVEIPHLSILTSLAADQKVLWFERLSQLHRVLAWLLLSLVTLHSLGAVYPSRHRALAWQRMALQRRGPRHAP